MALISWGTPTIALVDLDASEFGWIPCPTPIEGTTNTETTEGDKTEAKLEGGANEDVKYGENTYVLNYSLRKVKGRDKHIKDSDGKIRHNYAVAVMPEDPDCAGFLIQLSSVSVTDSFTAADGIVFAYKHAVLKPTSGNQMKYGVVKISKDSAGHVTKVTFKPDADSEQGFDGLKTYDLTRTIELTEVISD